MTNDNKIIKNDERAIFELRSLYRRYGYTQYKMSRFEEYDLYVRNKDFLVSDEVITFTDRNGRLLAMKPDVTLSIIKNTADAENTVQKVYYNENVYRVAQGTNNFREIMQTGLECIGDLGEYEIAEVVLLGAKSLELISKDYVLDISHMGLVSAVFEDSGLSDEGKSDALIFLQQKNIHELRALCEKENIPTDKCDKLCALADCTGSSKDILNKISSMLNTDKEKDAMTRFARLYDVISKSGYADKVKIDFSVGNHMKYYNGVVFKGYIDSIPTSVLSGGQYDRLLKKMGRKSGAIGFAIYLDLLSRLEAKESFYDIDTILLHDNDADTMELTKAAEKLSADGGVLVCAQKPKNVKYRRLTELREGSVAVIEEND